LLASSTTLALWSEREAFPHGLAVLAGVGNPGIRVGGEVRVLGEDLARGDELLELHQEALLADVGVQGVERLHPVKLLHRDVRLAERRHAQVDEGHAQRMPAEPAGRLMRRRPGGVIPADGDFPRYAHESALPQSAMAEHGRTATVVFRFSKYSLRAGPT
jgi:hypothetical protein